MTLITKQLIESLGIQLDEATIAHLEEHLETTLDSRVTAEIVELLDDDELIKLTALKGGSEDDLAQWLNLHVPDLKDIIEDETAILIGELAENSDQL